MLKRSPQTVAALLVLFELLLVAGAFILAHAVRGVVPKLVTVGQGFYPLASYLPLLPLVLLLWGGLLFASRIGRRRPGEPFSREALGLLKVCLGAMALLILLVYFVRLDERLLAGDRISRVWIVLLVVFSWLLLVSGRVLLRATRYFRRRAGSRVLELAATPETFDEAAYLRANPDVAQAVESGQFSSGAEHFEKFGHSEERRLRPSTAEISEVKREKLRRIKPLLRTDLPVQETLEYYDFLTEELREQFNIVDTDAVSGHPYDEHVGDLVERMAGGWVLDCGAGRRPVYYDNVVNFEIVAYDTTDVRGVGEVLPFEDACFDAVISVAVLEHVKEPFRCASEIVRVLKPGGELFCSVPFLQPVHGYPHHYYNMTSQGLVNLFGDRIQVDKVDVYHSMLPIFSLTWVVRSWADGLHGRAREEFLDLRISELMNGADEHVDRSFVRELPREKNFELACGTVLFARKKE